MKLMTMLLTTSAVVLMTGCGDPSVDDTTSPPPTSTATSSPTPDPEPTNEPSPDPGDPDYSCTQGDQEGTLVCHVSSSGEEVQLCVVEYDAFLDHEEHPDDYLGHCETVE